MNGNKVSQRLWKKTTPKHTWDVFEDITWVYFGPTNCEDFDEAL